MSWFRRVALIISGSALRFLLFFGVGLICMVLVFGNRNNIDKSMKETHASSRFVDAMISEMQKNNPGSSIPLNDPEVQTIIKSAFSESVIQTSSQSIINGTYDWLEGKTNEVHFTVDFRQAREQLANGISAYAFTKLGSKPTCFAIPEQIDPFTAGCKPPFTNLNEEQQKFAADLAGSEGFLPKAVFTEADLPKSKQGKTLTEQYAYIPKLYEAARLMPFVLPLIILGLVGLWIWLSSNKRHGFQQVGIAFIGTGVTLLITPILFVYVLPRFTQATQFSIGGNPTQQVFNDVANNLTANFYNLLINVSVQVVAIGLVIVIAERLTRANSLYANVEKKAGIVSSNTRRPSSSRKFKPVDIPVQSSEESTRRKPHRTRNKKYRRIPKKEI